VKKESQKNESNQYVAWTYLVNEHVQWRVHWLPLAAGHRYKSKAHADIKPLAVTRASQNLRRSPGGVRPATATSARPSCAVKEEKPIVMPVYVNEIKPILCSRCTHRPWSAWAAFLREIPNYSLLHNNTLFRRTDVPQWSTTRAVITDALLSSVNQYMRFSLTDS